MPEKRVYEFGPFHIGSDERLLFRGDELVPLAPKVADTLVVLLSNAGRVVGKDDLMKTIWPDAFVDEGGLARNISALRKALGDSEEGRFIETIPKRGYRFIAPLRTGAVEPPSAPAAAPVPRRLMPLAGLITAVLALVVIAAAAYYFARTSSNEQRYASLMVLPLENLSGDPAQDHIANTMTEELISRLTAMPSLRTISFPTAMTYRHSGKPLPQIGREQGVGAVVEGAMRLAGEQVRIDVTLRDAQTEKALWTGSYTRSLRDILKLENETAVSIADQIRVKLTPSEKLQLASTRPVNAEAWRDYSRGRMFWNRRGPDDIAEAIKYFEASIARDPGYARAHAGLADAWALLGSTGADAFPPRDAMPKAKKAAGRAVALDPSLAEAHASLGYVLLSYDWDLRGARREFDRAIELNPGYATAHHWYAHYWLAAGQPRKALEAINTALSYDSQSLIINAGLGWFYYHAREYDAAIEQYRTTLKIAPEFSLAHALLGMAYERKGEYSEAEAEFQKARDARGSAAFALAGLGGAYALAGRKRDARLVLDRLEHPASGQHVPAVYIAAIYAAMGDRDRAIRFIERAVEERSDYVLYLGSEPWAEPLRADPRFQRIVHQVAQARL